MTMSSTQNSLIEEELLWLEKKVADIKKYVDDNPYNTLTDRIIMLNDKEVLAANVEQQQKAIMLSLKECATLAEQIDKLRTIEQAKVEGRGKQKVNKMMEEFVKNAKG